MRFLLALLVCVPAGLHLGRDVPLLSGPPVAVPTPTPTPPPALADAEREEIRAALAGAAKAGEPATPARRVLAMNAVAAHFVRQAALVGDNRPHDGRGLPDDLVEALEAMRKEVEKHFDACKALREKYSDVRRRECVVGAAGEGKAAAEACREAAAADEELGKFLKRVGVPSVLTAQIEPLREGWERSATALAPLEEAGADAAKCVRACEKLAEHLPAQKDAFRQAATRRLEAWLDKKLEGDGKVILSRSKFGKHGTYPAAEVRWVDMANEGNPIDDLFRFAPGGAAAGRVKHFVPPGAGLFDYLDIDRLEPTPLGRAAHEYNILRKAAGTRWTRKAALALCGDDARPGYDFLKEMETYHPETHRRLVLLRSALSECKTLFPER